MKRSVVVAFILGCLIGAAALYFFQDFKGAMPRTQTQAPEDRGLEITPDTYQEPPLDAGPTDIVDPEDEKMRRLDEIQNEIIPQLREIPTLDPDTEKPAPFATPGSEQEEE